LKILLDHCLPRRLKNSFPTHDVATAVEVGWDALRNGKLLAAAATRFDVLLTIDKNLKHQQNLTTLPVAVIVILAPTNRLADLVGFVPAVEDALKTLTPRTLIEVTPPRP
jgi:predicted nuclease of predicted toxin-antitoxin system